MQISIRLSRSNVFKANSSVQLPTMWTTALLFLLTTYSNQITAQSGRTCKTPNNESGTCISIYRCTTLLDVVTTKDNTQKKFLKESQCGYQAGPLVCCGTETNYRFNTNGDNSEDIQETRRPQPSSSKNRLDDKQCGIQTVDKVYGGTATALNEFPWMALLQYRRKNNNLQFSCGGSLISRRYVLTAGHCVEGDILRKVGPLVRVRLGEHDTSKNPDCIPKTNICNDPFLDVDVERTIAHQNYDGRDHNRYNDIALVRLARDVSFTDQIRPICLPNRNEMARQGEKVIVSGWGRTETRSFSAIKQKVSIPIAEPSTCLAQFKQAGINLARNQLCAGGEPGKDSCSGDSGGPLMRTRTNSSQWIMEGLVSFGAACGTEGWPGIYTRVNAYLDWIQETIQ